MNKCLDAIDRFFNWIDKCYWRFMNSDPVRNCPVYKEEGCCLVDGPLCYFPNCDIYLNKMGDDFTICSKCKKIHSCVSNNYGLGCYDKEIS